MICHSNCHVTRMGGANVFCTQIPPLARWEIVSKSSCRLKKSSIHPLFFSVGARLLFGSVLRNWKIPSTMLVRCCFTMTLLHESRLKLRINRTSFIGKTSAWCFSLLPLVNFCFTVWAERVCVGWSSVRRSARQTLLSLWFWGDWGSAGSRFVSTHLHRNAASVSVQATS